ncbi:MAG TPA: hypothetical protein VFO23_07040 [Steroidobacteraceae bacterium]|nr:hypothetical protein [Steroidobacteraceae bacterium]
MNNWMNTTVAINDSWGQGAVDTLSTPLGKQPQFTLRPRHLLDAKGQRSCAHFGIDFSSGYLADGWQGVNFIPIGTAAVTGISGLPPWDPSQQNTYRKMIQAAYGSLGDSRTQRLEGVIPYMGQHGIAYNKVKLFYVTNAVQGPEPDLVVVTVSTHVSVSGTVQGKQDGGAQGPPKK